MGSSSYLKFVILMLFYGKSVLGEDGKCEEITIPMCKEIGYNFTRLPNQFNHETQDEVRYFISMGLLNLVQSVLLS